MHRALVSRRVRIIVARDLGVAFAKVREDSDFRHNLGADSLDMVQLPARFEEEFDVRISDDEAAFAQTIGTAIDIIHAKLENQARVRRVFARTHRPVAIDWDQANDDPRLVTAQRPHRRPGGGQ